MPLISGSSSAIDWGPSHGVHWSNYSSYSPTSPPSTAIKDTVVFLFVQVQIQGQVQLASGFQQ